jgi:hypothetical protein
MISSPPSSSILAEQRKAESPVDGDDPENVTSKDLSSSAQVGTGAAIDDPNMKIELTTTDDGAEDNGDAESAYTWVQTPRWWLWVAIGSLVAAGIAIGTLCGATGQCRRRNRNNSLQTPADEELASPTVSPAPTAERRNDRCEEAVGPLRIGGRSTVAELFDDAAISLNPCYSSTTPDKEGEDEVPMRGLWYTVIGGGEVVRASTCPKIVASSILADSANATVAASAVLAPTRISIMIGGDNDKKNGGCGNLQCLVHNNDFCGEQSSVSWMAEKGVQYYIFVEGSTFELDLDYEYNGFCENSIGPIDARGQVIAGSLRGAGFLPFETCDLEAARGGQVWYWVKGTGSWLVASTCHPGTDFGAKVDVYGLRQCVVGTCVSPRDSDCGNGFQMIWLSELGVDYRILVYKTSLIQGIHFELSVNEFEPLPNDACANAQKIELGSTVRGDTKLATFDYDTPDCGNLFAPGAWYTITGNGKRLLASTCHEDTDYGSQISIYTGTCGLDTLSCVLSGAQYCNEKASVYWESEIGVTYYVLVHGSRYGVFPNVGKYALTVEPFVTEANNMCQDAMLLDSKPGMTIGSTFAATVSYEAPICSTFFSTAPGVWFRVNGEGVNLRASTCDPETDFDTQISIYDGSCDKLRCVNTDDNSCGLQSSVAWTAVAGLTYYIYVHGRLESSVGRFALHIEEYTPLVDNDFCDAAVSAKADGKLIAGTTTGATFDNAGTCVAPNAGPGVFYTIQGTGRALRASLCNNATLFNAALSVYEGDCVSLRCVDGNSDTGGSCGLLPEVSWQTTSNTTYYVLVHGYDSRFGDFGLVFDEPEPKVANDFCVNAIPTELSDQFIMGTTKGATADASPVCSGILQEGRGVWYSVVGDGKRFEASTCNTGEERTTYIDTVLSIFVGNCSNLTCTVADDNFCGFQSRLVWLTEPGVTYYILVHGPMEGDFGLVVQEFVPKTANDFCTAAQGPLWPSNDTYVGSTVRSSFDGAATCGLVENTSVSSRICSSSFISNLFDLK